MRAFWIVLLLGTLQYLSGCSSEGIWETSKPRTVASRPGEGRDRHTEKEALSIIRKTRGAFVWEYPQHVRISLTCWPEEAIAQLKHVRCLRWLAICSPRIPDSGLAELAKLSSLTELSLSGPTSDSGMQELEGMTQLEVIDLSSAKITDVGLAVLAKLPNLRTVKLCSCQQVTDAGVGHLKKKGISVHVSGLH